MFRRVILQFQNAMTADDTRVLFFIVASTTLISYIIIFIYNMMIIVTLLLMRMEKNHNIRLISHPSNFDGCRVINSETIYGGGEEKLRKISYNVAFHHVFNSDVSSYSCVYNNNNNMRFTAMLTDRTCSSSHLRRRNRSLSVPDTTTGGAMYVCSVSCVKSDEGNKPLRRPTANFVCGGIRW